jgi:hypothetical protein
VLGSAFLTCGVAHALRLSGKSARRVVLASFLRPPLLLALMALDKIG